MEISLNYHGTMLPDYFSGTSGAMLSIYFDSTTKNQDIINELKNEINAIGDHIEYTGEYHGFNDIDLLFDVINEKILKLETENDMDKIFYPDFEIEFDCKNFSEYDHAIAIFSIEFIED